MLLCSKKLKNIAFSLLAMMVLYSTSARGKDIDQWLSITFDNDIFLGDDSGYTNGIFFSGFNAFEGDFNNNQTVLLKPLRPTMPTIDRVEREAEAFTFGQMLSTPNDISLLDPPMDEPPYGALLFYAKSYLQVASDYADQITTTIGVVGPTALGKPAQTLVHKATGSEPPKGWDTQIRNEVVFSFSRGRLWRNWVSSTGNADVLSLASADLGTLQTSLRGEIYFRYGRGLKRSFATPLLSSSRTSNPVAIENGWYVYAGLSAGSRLRFILLDGNTFKSSRSVDYKKEYLGLTAGLSYAWERSGFTFAVSDASLLQKIDGDKLDKVTQYGSLTYAWKLGAGSSKAHSWFLATPDEQSERGQ